MVEYDYATLSLIIKCNPGSVLEYKEGLGFTITGKANFTFAIPDDVQLVGGMNKFHLISNGETIAWVTLK